MLAAAGLAITSQPRTAAAAPGDEVASSGPGERRVRPRSLSGVRCGMRPYRAEKKKPASPQPNSEMTPMGVSVTIRDPKNRGSPAICGNRCGNKIESVEIESNKNMSLHRIWH